MDWLVLPYNPKSGTPGDYIKKPDGNIETATGAVEVRQMVLFALLLRKGWLYDETIGSDLWKIPRDYPAIPSTAELAQAMTVKALDDQLSGVIEKYQAVASVNGDLEVSYKIIATGELDTVRITQEDLLNA